MRPLSTASDGPTSQRTCRMTQSGEGRAVVVELDEMWPYLKKSNKLWVWKAWDRATGRLVDWELGGRDRATLERLLTRLRRSWNPRLYCADGWEAYAELIPPGQLYVGKEQTHGVERNHARQRHWLAPFRRRSIVVSKAKRMVDAAIALFARFGGNDKIGELVSMLA